MALQLLAVNVQNTGVDIVNSYQMVAGVQLDNLTKKAYILIFTFPSKTARDSGKTPIRQGTVNVTNEIKAGVAVNSFDDYFSANALSIAGNNPYAMAYKYLKTLPEFAGATDV